MRCLGADRSSPGLLFVGSLVQWRKVGNQPCFGVLCTCGCNQDCFGHTCLTAKLCFSFARTCNHTAVALSSCLRPDGLLVEVMSYLTSRCSEVEGCGLQPPTLGKPGHTKLCPISTTLEVWGSFVCVVSRPSILRPSSAPHHFTPTAFTPRALTLTRPNSANSAVSNSSAANAHFFSPASRRLAHG